MGSFRLRNLKKADYRRDLRCLRKQLSDVRHNVRQVLSYS